MIDAPGGFFMSDTATDTTQTDGDPQVGETEEAKTFDAEYVAKLRRENAKFRTEAKDNAAAAKRLRELEDAQKSESERASDRIAKAEAEVASVPAKVADALKTHLVELHSIDNEDAELFLTATDPDLLLKQVTRLLVQSDKKRTKQNVVPREGQNPTAATSDLREFTRNLFGTE